MHIFINFPGLSATMVVEKPKMTDIEFEKIVSEVRGRLISVARRFARATGGAYDSEDIVQEALAELYRLFLSGYGIRDIEALAVKITKTVCVRFHRKERLDTSTLEGVDLPGDSSASELIDVEEADNLKKQLWSRLSETQKRYLQMRCEEMTLDEIAQKSGCPKSSVKATISQARKRLSSIKKQYGDE